MLNIQPKTYNDVLRLSRCLELKRYIPVITDERIEEMYRFISEDKANKISVTPEMISFLNGRGECMNAYPVTVPIAISFDHIVFGTEVYKVLDHSSSYSSGYSGSSSNNNNNNNNNNNG